MQESTLKAHFDVLISFVIDQTKDEDEEIRFAAFNLLGTIFLRGGVICNL